MVLLPEGANLTLSELREIAARQQQQIEAQQQLLIAKVQRLKFLKQQEARHHQEAQTTENERLRFIQEKLESQEVKLRRLRTLNGQVEQQRTNNNQLSSELESVQLLISEKEKELSLTIEKVDDLTLQLQELRKGNLNELKNDNISTSSAQELARLKHELLYQTKLTEQQSLRISQQRKLLTQRQDEVSRADQRILELKQRLHRKQLHNQQLSKQLQMTITVPKPNNQKHLRPSSCNIAAVEPVRRSQEQERSQDDFHANLTTVDFREFLPNKNDPKYQTLPYNTKFTVRNGMADESDAQAHKVETKSAVTEPDSNENENSISTKPVPFECTSPVINANKSYVQSKLNHLSPRPYGVPYAVCHVPSTVPISSPSSTSSNVTTIHPTLTNVNNFAVPVSTTSCLTLSSPSQPVSAARATLIHSNTYQDNNSNTTNFNTVVDKQNSLHPCVLQSSTSNKDSNAVSWVKPSPNKADDNSKAHTEYSGLSISNNNNNKPAVPPKPIKPLPPPRQIQLDGSCDGKQDTVDAALAVLKNVGLETSTGYSGYRERLLYYQYFPRYGLKGRMSKIHYADKREQTKQEETQGTNAENSVNSKEESPQKRTVIGQLPIQPKPLTIKKPMHVEPPRLRNSGIPVLSTHKRSVDTNLQAHSLLGMQFGNSTSQKHSPVRKLEHPFHRQETNEAGSSENEKTDSNSEISTSKETSNIASIVNSSKTDQGKQNEEEKSSSFSKFEIQVETDDDNFGSVDSENSVRTEGDGDSGCETVPSNAASYLGEKKSELETNLQENALGQESVALRRVKKGNLKTKDTAKSPRRVSFDPLALLLDASLEGEVELVKKTACEVANPSAANDEGITALHNAICAGHLEIVTFLVELGCDVNTQDSDGWTPLHCAASCNNLPMVKYLVEHGACIFATTFSDQETAAEKCEEDEDGFDGCSEYLYSIQEKLGIMNGGVVYAVYDYERMRPDELSFKNGDEIIVLKKGDEVEREWWWSSLHNQEGYVPRNLLGLYPRVNARSNQ